MVHGAVSRSMRSTSSRGDMDRAGELVSLEYPAVHHLLDRRAADAEVLGRLHHGNDFSILVFHPNLPARQRQGPGTLKDTRPGCS